MINKTIFSKYHLTEQSMQNRPSLRLSMMRDRRWLAHQSYIVVEATRRSPAIIISLATHNYCSRVVHIERERKINKFVHCLSSTRQISNKTEICNCLRSYPIPLIVDPCTRAVPATASDRMRVIENYAMTREILLAIVS